MAKSLPRLAILGAGPIGLEAAHYARALKYPFILIERSRPADFVQRWGHVRMFTPFSMNATPLGLKTIKSAKSAHVLPRDDAVTTGRELVEAYLAPLAELLQPDMHSRRRCCTWAGRACSRKMTSAARNGPKLPFVCCCATRKGNASSRPTSSSIAPAPTASIAGSAKAASRPWAKRPRSRTSPMASRTCLETKKIHYANKNILVVGGGYSAATTVCNLAQLGQEAASTWVVWIARSSGSQPLRRVPQDPLRERDRLAAQANNIATRTDANVEFHAETTVEADRVSRGG